MEVCSVRGPSSQNVADPPEVVVHTSHGSTVGRMREFDSVGGTSGRGDRCAKSEDKATGNEMSHLVGCSLNGGSD